MPPGTSVSDLGDLRAGSDAAVTNRPDMASEDLVDDASMSRSVQMIDPKRILSVIPEPTLRARILGHRGGVRTPVP